MGGSQSKPGEEPIVETPKINHPRFNNINFTRNKQEDVIEVKIPLPSIKEYNQWVSALTDAPTQSDNFLFPQAHSFQKEGLCGSSGFVNAIYQNFPYVLAHEISNRASHMQKFFDEPELWYLIYTLISAGHEFHNKGKKIGDVRPENVFINEDGQVKVACHLTWPAQSTNYHKTFYQKEPTYLSPEEIKDIKFAKMEPSCDPKSAESFSIGLTCLDAGTLGNSHPLFMKGFNFDYGGLSSRLQQLHNVGYSQILCMVVGSLCEPDSDRRSSCSDLYNWLQPYEESIINLDSFSVNTLPEKLRSQYGPTLEQESPVVVQQAHLQNEISEKPIQVALNQNQHIPYFVPNQQTAPVGYISSSQAQNNGQQPMPQPIPSLTSSQTKQPGYYVKPGQIVAGQQQFVRSAYQSVNEPVPQMLFAPQNPGNMQYSGQVVTQSIRPQGEVDYRQTTAPTSYYAYSQPGGQFNQPSSFIRPVSNMQEAGQKTSMNLTLEKIDQQLQMSRKMFPS